MYMIHYVMPHIYIDEQYCMSGEYSDEHIAVSTRATPPSDYASCKDKNVTPIELKEGHIILLTDV